MDSSFFQANRSAWPTLASLTVVGVDPVEYFRAVLPVLGRRVRLRDLTELLPAPWKARRAAAAAYASSGDDSASARPAG